MVVGAVKEVEVLKKLKLLAIFGVQAKSIRQQLFSSSKKSNHGGLGALAAIDSIMLSKSR